MSQPTQPFLETIYHLRTVEHIILYNRLDTVPHKELQEVVAFLEGEYERECTDYPFTPPAFSAAAALWGAKTVYFAAQLYLYRQNKPAELPSILPPFNGKADASAMLSADLCLRFLPAVKFALEAVDANDALIPVLEQFFVAFPYSGIGRDGEFTPPDTAPITTNDCLTQLYLDRIAERKAAKWAEQDIINSAIRANLGNHKNVFWRELNN